MVYVKEINGRQVFSACNTIQTNEGLWISNPTAEQIAEAGWIEYVAPEAPVYVQTSPAMSEIIMAVKTMLAKDAAELSDEEALSVAALYPTWASKMNTTVSVGDRLWYDDKLYKVIQTHTVQNNWTPDVSDSLFVEVSIEEWPEFVQPTGAQDAYNIGDKITFNGKHYVSLIDSNVYSPEAYPQGWQEQ